MKKILTLLIGLMFTGQLWAEDKISFDIEIVTGKFALTFTVIDEENKYVEVSTRFTKYDWGTLEIPSEVTNSETGTKYTVTQIAKRGFEWCSEGMDKTLIIPNTVTTICDAAFDNCYMSSITIPNSVKYIGKEAFYGSNFQSIDLPSSVTHIGENAFAHCENLASITIPDGITSISKRAFFYCKRMKSVTIPNSVTSIGQEAFSKSGIVSLEIPGSVKSIGAWAFDNCANLESVIMHEGVELLSDGVFYVCQKLRKVILPQTITTIGDGTGANLGVFASCTRLCDIEIPANVTSVRNKSFTDVLHIKYQGSLSDAPWGAKNQNGFTENDFIYKDENKKVLIAYIGESPSVVIPESVTTIGEYAFAYCDFLTSVSIPNSVKEIGTYAFYNCSKISLLNIPNSVTSIGADAFEDCTNLTSVNIPNSVKTLQEYTFYYCINLTSVIIPNNITGIGRFQFFGCSNLTAAYIPKSVTSVREKTFNGNNENLIIYCECAETENPQNWNAEWNSGNYTVVWNQLLVKYASANPTHGTVTAEGGASLGNALACEKNTQITLTATAEDGCAFVRWSDGNTDNPRTITVTESGEYTAEFTGTITSGALTLIYGDKVTAQIKGDFASTDQLPLQIDKNIDVAEVTIKRSFTKDVPSTVMFPFDFTPDNTIGNFYTLASVAPVDGVWTATMSQPITGKLQANIPYVFKPSKSVTELKFENVTLIPTVAGTNGKGEWRLNGAYSKTMLDADDEINYGFAGQDAEGIQKGQFVRAGEGTWVDPMRCYLTYCGNDSRLTKAATVLPDQIRVVFPDEVEQPDNGEIITPVSSISEFTSAKVWSYNRTIFIESQPDTDYTIVDLTGRILQTGVTHSTREEISLGHSTGIVIVKIGYKSYKINL